MRTPRGRLSNVIDSSAVGRSAADRTVIGSAHSSRNRKHESATQLSARGSADASLTHNFHDAVLEAARAGAAQREAAGRGCEGELIESDEISREAFDPNSRELQSSWSAGARTIYCINAYPNGITLSTHLPPQAVPLPVAAVDSEQAVREPGARGTRLEPSQFHLRFRDTRDYQLPQGRYFLHREGFAMALEEHLSHLRKSGQLADAVFYFGTTTDAFLSLHKKFDVTMRCIDLLERYAPGLTVFQTRSPMVISVLPALKHLGDRAVVAIPIETISERAVQRYMPGKPRIGERLVAAEGLRRQGIRVELQVSPILPYGDERRNAWDFAEVLERHADYITFGCLASGVPAEEKQLKTFPISQRLESDEQFFWLRPYCYQYVYQAVKALAPEKLLLPSRSSVAPSQLGLFAA